MLTCSLDMNWLPQVQQDTALRSAEKAQRRLTLGPAAATVPAPNGTAAAARSRRAGSRVRRAGRRDTRNMTVSFTRVRPPGAKKDSTPGTGSAFLIVPRARGRGDGALRGTVVVRRTRVTCIPWGAGGRYMAARMWWWE